MGLFKNLDHKKPQKSFNLHMKFLYFLGLWPPQNIVKNQQQPVEYDYFYMKNKIKYWIYQIYSVIFRFGFLYFYTFTQIMYFRNVNSLKDIADALFLLLTQFSLIYKVNIFDRNQIKIRKLVQFLETNTCLASKQEEEIFITTAMKRTILSFLSFFIPAQITIMTWAIFPLTDEIEIRLPLPAWYPFDMTSNWIFGIMYIYQIFGIYVSSWYNVSIETFLSGLLAHGTAQVDRLGYQLSKVGYIKRNQLRAQLHNGVNVQNELKLLIKFHITIMRYIADVEDIFRNTIFVQLFASVIIVCMTGLQLIGTPVNSVKFLSMALYLFAMIAEITSFCWIGNELIYSSTHLTENAYFSNFTEFDLVSKKTLIFFMIRANYKEICFKAGNIFKVTLSLATLVNIIKTSYSYFAVLQTIQSQQ